MAKVTIRGATIHLMKSTTLSTLLIISQAPSGSYLRDINTGEIMKESHQIPKAYHEYILYKPDQTPL